MMETADERVSVVLVAAGERHSAGAVNQRSNAGVPTIPSVLQLPNSRWHRPVLVHRTVCTWARWPDVVQLADRRICSVRIVCIGASTFADALSRVVEWVPRPGRCIIADRYALIGLAIAIAVRVGIEIGMDMETEAGMLIGTTMGAATGAGADMRAVS